MSKITFKKKEVTYEDTVDGLDIEIEGIMRKEYDGRASFYTFEPDWFVSKEARDYYDENWENVQDAILQQFNNQ